jgi:AcrR family transcriptional regulator
MAGRPRDPDIDQAVLRVAQRHLAERGYDAMSVVAVAEDAGTTRQAVYRRWPCKADLATAAIAALSEAAARPPTDDPYADLVAELAAFHRGVSRPNGVGMVGTMLQDSVDPELRRLFRARVVAPRRARLRAILDRAAAAGLVDADADLDYAVAACTGTRYALHLASGRVDAAWPERTARLVWRAVGGTLPAG